MALLERFMARSALLGRHRVAAIIDKLAQVDLPPGVSAEPIEGGIRLSGVRLRRRIIDDVRLRSFADVAKGVMR